MGGEPAGRGEDREVQLLVNPLGEAERGPLMERLRDLPEWEIAIPLEELTNLAVVKKNSIVARISEGKPGKEGRDIFGNPIPGMAGNDPDLKLFQGLELHGQDIIALKDGLLLISSRDKRFRGELIDYADSRIQCRVSEDDMEARIDLVRAAGPGAILRVENVLGALKAIGVVQGIDRELVEKAVQTARARGSQEGVIVARGQLPAAKGSPIVKWHVPVPGVPGEEATSAQVRAGTLVAEILGSYEEGRPGFTVKGGLIPAEKGTLNEIAHDASIQEKALEDDEKPTPGRKALFAAVSGGLLFDGTTLQVRAVQGIEGDVGPQTGNINFLGDVKINGKVLPGFSVVAGKDVFVSGVAESSLISAGGRVVVVRGVRGAGKGVVRAKNTVELAFAERATIMAVEDVKVRVGCLFCNIKTNGKLRIEADKGRLAGGVYQARQGIETGDMGSEKGGKTEISFGQNYLIKDQIIALQEELEKIHAGIKKADEKMKELTSLADRGDLQQEAAVFLQTVRAEKVRLLRLREELNLRVFTLQEKFEEHHDSEIRIRGTVYPGVILESHNRYYLVKKTRSKVIFYFDRESGHIKEKSLG
jgi:uncharacterized protein (DUF342 family)